MAGSQYVMPAGHNETFMGSGPSVLKVIDRKFFDWKRRILIDDEKCIIARRRITRKPVLIENESTPETGMTFDVRHNPIGDTDKLLKEIVNKARNVMNTIRRLNPSVSKYTTFLFYCESELYKLYNMYYERKEHFKDNVLKEQETLLGRPVKWKL